MDHGIEWDDLLSLIIFTLAGFVFLIALRAYRRTRTTRVLLFASAFGVFFLKAVFLGVEILYLNESAVMDALNLVADAAILLLFLAGMLKE